MTQAGDAAPVRVAHPLARAVSIALHPFAVFAALALSMAWRYEPASLGRVALGMGVAVGIVSVLIWNRRRGGHWQTVDASRPHERPLLYRVVLIVLVGYWAWAGGRASALSAGVLVALAMIVVAALANRWIKLSLHMASLAFAGLALWPAWPWASLTALGLLPVLAWSRVRLARHTWPEIAGGTGLGLAAGAALLQFA